MKPKSIVVLLLILGLSLCLQGCKTSEQSTGTPTAPPSKASPASPTQTPAPTSSPTPEYYATWSGDWHYWTGTEENSPDFEFIEAQMTTFTLEGKEILAEIKMMDDVHTIRAAVSEDGITATGNVSYADGRSGPVEMMIQKDGDSFIGNLDDNIVFCGSRTMDEKPEPCYLDIRGEWGGEWVIWFGPEETEALIVLKVEGDQISTLIYDFTGTISADGRTITGEISEMGFTGIVNAEMLGNNVQFRGNISGLFPFCGSIVGGSKPDPCMGP